MVATNRRIKRVRKGMTDMDFSNTPACDALGVSCVSCGYLFRQPVTILPSTFLVRHSSVPEAVGGTIWLAALPPVLEVREQ